MKIQRIFLWMVVVGLIVGNTACLETTEWELDQGTNGQLVVEAILTNEPVNQEIRLSLSYDALNGAAPAVTDAVVSVSVSGQSYAFFADDTAPGIYKSEVPFSVINNLVYSLHIEWQGRNYTASSELSSVAPLPLITFRRIVGTDSLTFVEFAPLYNANQQAMYEMNIDWSHLSNGELTKAKMLFYTFSSIDVSELVRPPRDTVMFPRGSIVVAKKFGLNDDFATYLRALAIETDWQGGLFYGASASLPTNISNDGLGFFSTCAVVTDTLIAQ